MRLEKQVRKCNKKVREDDIFTLGQVAEPGLMRLTRNQVGPQGSRGFKSLPVRHSTKLMTSHSVSALRHP